MKSKISEKILMVIVLIMILQPAYIVACPFRMHVPDTAHPEKYKQIVQGTVVEIETFDFDLTKFTDLTPTFKVKLVDMKTLHGKAYTKETIVVPG